MQIHIESGIGLNQSSLMSRTVQYWQISSGAYQYLITGQYTGDYPHILETGTVTHGGDRCEISAALHGRANCTEAFLGCSYKGEQARRDVTRQGLIDALVSQGRNETDALQRAYGAL